MFKSSALEDTKVRGGGNGGIWPNPKGDQSLFSLKRVIPEKRICSEENKVTNCTLKLHKMYIAMKITFLHFVRTSS